MGFLGLGLVMGTILGHSSHEAFLGPDPWKTFSSMLMVYNFYNTKFFTANKYDFYLY